jgi:hypothetical protein
MLAVAPARADDFIVPGSIWMGVEGGYYTAIGSSQPVAPSVRVFFSGAAILPSSPERVRNAWTYSISGGAKLNPDWDFRLAYTGIRGNRHKTNLNGTTSTLAAVVTPSGSSILTVATPHLRSSIKSHFDIGDFDVGRSYGLGSSGGTARLFVGLRVASFTQDTTATLTLNSFSSTETGNSHSWGVGPRLGASGAYPLAQWGPGTLSLTGEAAGAALFGEANRSTSDSGNFVAFSGQSGFSSNKWETIWNVEGTVGLAYSFPLGGSEATVNVGYRAQGWWSLINTSRNTFSGAVNSTGDQFFHGPVAGLKVKF